MAMVLGGIVFRNFEIPEHVSFPIKQRHHIHYFVGSDRTVDATGPDPQPIRWEGRFTGPDATPRARSLQVMTASGNEWPCVFGSFQEQVLITSFDPIMTKPYDIHYAIEVLPTTNQGGGAGGLSSQSFVTTGAQIATDLSAALTGSQLAASIAATLQSLGAP